MSGPEQPVAAAEGTTSRLSSFLAELNLGDLPTHVLERVSHVTLDGIGCALIGAHLPWSERGGRRSRRSRARVQQR